jgi:hypothetical protein
MAGNWNLPYSGDLLAAFPEFFPSSVISEFKADIEKTGVFRKIFEIRGSLGKQEAATLLLSRYEIRGKIACGMIKHIAAHSPGRMRVLYRLPEHGARGRLLRAYFNWFWTRLCGVRPWMRRNPVLRKYAHFVEAAESSQNS